MPAIHVGRVDADEFQFVVADVKGGELTADTDGVDILTYDPSLPDLLTVATGAHWGPVEVLTQICHTPPEAQDEWDEIVEVSIQCAAGLQICELMGDRAMTIADSGGHWRLRLSARGRDAGYQRYSSSARAKILEHYFIQIWRSAEAPAQTLRARPPPAVIEQRERVHLSAGRDAAKTLNIDLNRLPGARALSGELVTVRADWVYRGPRRRYFPILGDLSLWNCGGGSSGGDLAVGMYYVLDREHPDSDTFDGVPVSCVGTIQGTCLLVDRPATVVMDWQWFTREHTHPFTYGDPLGDPVPFLPQASVVRIDLTQHRRPDGKTCCKVSIEHSQLPREWAADMTAAWKCKLEAGDILYGFGDQ